LERFLKTKISAMAFMTAFIRLSSERPKYIMLKVLKANA